MANPSKEDRLFIRDGRKSYRRSFSVTEVRWGVTVLAVLAVLAGWIAWKGAHPDPTLFESDLESLEARKPQVVLDGQAPSAALDARNPGNAPAAPGGRGGSAADRAPFPTGLALAGWKEGPVAHYDNTNLYVKIDGREDYYKSFGFEALHWVSLAREDDAATTVDIELFDMGKAANALGAYAGERPPDAVPQLESGGLWHRARNATFCTAGRYYLRLLGSDESAPVLQQVEAAHAAIVAALPAEPLPWGYALFSGGMKLDPGKVSYTLEGAYSLGFARNVYAAPLGEGDLEGFVALAPESGAAALAARFVKGFQDYGDAAGRVQNADWVQDRYVKTYATAVAEGPWVAGVRGAASPQAGAAGLQKVRAALRALPATVLAEARTERDQSAASPEGESYEGGDGSSAPGEPSGEPEGAPEGN